MERSIKRALFAAALLYALLGMLGGCGNIGGGPPPPPTTFLLTAPTDSVTGVGLTPTLEWSDAAGETRYYVEIDDNIAFSTPYTGVVSANTTSYSVPVAAALAASSKYYWRVRAVNDSGPTTAPNSPFSFTP